MLFWDFEREELLTEEQLKLEYEELKSNGGTEAETFTEYLDNCMEWNNGTLELYRDLNHFMEKMVEKILVRDYVLNNSEVMDAVDDIVYRCFAVTGIPAIEDLEDYIEEYMDR